MLPIPDRRNAILLGCQQGGTGPLDPPGLPLLRTSKILTMAGHAPVQLHQCTTGDWKMMGLSWYGLWLYRVKSLRPGGPGGAVLPWLPAKPCYALGWCNSCSTQTVGHEPHHTFACPHSRFVRAQHPTGFRMRWAQCVYWCGKNTKRLSDTSL